MSEVLDILRERALRIKLKALRPFAGAVDVPSVIKALDALNESYGNYIEAEARNRVKVKHTALVEKEIKALKDDAKLLFVDLDFSSFAAAVTPNSVTHPHPFHFVPDLGEFKEQTFEDFKTEVIFSDPDDAKVLSRLEKKFRPEERRAIFNPLYKGLFNSETVEFHAGSRERKLHRVNKSPSEATLQRLIPAKDKEKAQHEERTVLIYAKAEGDPDLFGERKLKVTKRLAVEELRHETYPYQFAKIGFGDSMLTLHQTCTAVVRFDEDTALYHVDLEELDIHTWGATREEAIEAFEFSFTDLAEEFLDTPAKGLTPKAVELQKTLAAMIKHKSRS